MRKFVIAPKSNLLIFKGINPVDFTGFEVSLNSRQCWWSSVSSSRACIRLYFKTPYYTDFPK